MTDSSTHIIPIIPRLSNNLFRDSRPYSSESLQFYFDNGSTQKRKSNQSPSPLRTNRHQINKHSKLIFSEYINPPKQQSMLSKYQIQKNPSIRELIFSKKENQLLRSKNTTISIDSKRRSQKIPQCVPLSSQLSWSNRNKRRNKKIIQASSTSQKNLKKRSQSPQTPQFHATKSKLKKNRTPSQAEFFSPYSSFEHKFLQQQQKLTKNSFRIMKKLGKGCFGDVYLAQQKKTGFLVALKVMQKRKLSEENYLNQILREIKIQSFIRNPFVAELYGVFDDHDHIYLIMELCSDQSLYSQIRREHKIEEEKVANIILYVCQGLKALHSETVIHRDLKPENIMTSFGFPKITDFGWAVYCGQDQKMRDTLSGSPLYHSPELVQRKLYDEKVDIWAVGTLTYECLLGMTPFKVYSLMNLHRIVENDLNFPQYAEISPEAQEFITACLQKKANKRPSIHQLLSFKFLKQQQNISGVK